MPQGQFTANLSPINHEDCCRSMVRLTLAFHSKRQVFLPIRHFVSPLRRPRFRLLATANDMDNRAIQALEQGTPPIPTMRERRWVSAAQLASRGCRFPKFDSTLQGIVESGNLVPPRSARLKLARTMDERSLVLQGHPKPKYYADMVEFKFYAFLHSWEENGTGEIGSLIPLENDVLLVMVPYPSRFLGTSFPLNQT